MRPKFLGSSSRLNASTNYSRPPTAKLLDWMDEAAIVSSVDAWSKVVVVVVATRRCTSLLLLKCLFK
jgi:hypothetical protein